MKKFSLPAEWKKNFIPQIMKRKSRPNLDHYKKRKQSHPEFRKPNFTCYEITSPKSII
jgi:hypothetical protein